MSIGNFRTILAGLSSEVSGDQGISAGFPFEALARASEETTFEAATAALRELQAWEARCKASFPDVDLTGISEAVADARIELDIALDCFEPTSTGGLIRLPDEAPRTDQIRYLTLGRAVLEGGHEVSVFSRKLRAIPVYDGAEAMEARLAGKGLPAPVGSRAEYRVAILNGEIQHPPLWPGSIARLEEHDPDGAEPEF